MWTLAKSHTPPANCFRRAAGPRRLQIYKVEGTWAISPEKRAKTPVAASFFGFSSNFWKGLADGASDA
jgi:hypothetical protein